jgi:hypothetical protein
MSYDSWKCGLVDSFDFALISSTSQMESDAREEEEPDYEVFEDELKNSLYEKEYDRVTQEDEAIREIFSCPAQQKVCQTCRLPSCDWDGTGCSWVL